MNEAVTSFIMVAATILAAGYICRPLIVRALDSLCSLIEAIGSWWIWLWKSHSMGLAALFVAILMLAIML